MIEEYSCARCQEKFRVNIREGNFIPQYCKTCFWVAQRQHETYSGDWSEGESGRWVNAPVIEQPDYIEEME